MSEQKRNLEEVQVKDTYKWGSQYMSLQFKSIKYKFYLSLIEKQKLKWNWRNCGTSDEWVFPKDFSF